MTRQFEPRDPDFEPRVARSFEAQTVMQTLNASLATSADNEKLVATLVGSLMACIRSKPLE